MGPVAAAVQVEPVATVRACSGGSLAAGGNVAWQELVPVAGTGEITEVRRARV